mgnify:CR=1 FL=1
MLSVLFTILMIGIFGKLIGFAFHAAWGLTKVVCTLVVLPVVLIANSGEYIDLVHGIKVSMSHSAARAGRHNFFAAVVKYDNGDFVFSAPRTEAKVNKSTLVRHYGTAIVSF